MRCVWCECIHAKKISIVWELYTSRDGEKRRCHQQQQKDQLVYTNTYECVIIL